MGRIDDWDQEMVTLLCLECGRPHDFEIDSPQATGVFDVFCPDRDCEDSYMVKL